MAEDRDFLPFKRLFREIKLQTDVGLKLHKMKRTDWDKKFHAVYAELDILIDPVEQHQKELAESCGEYDFISIDGTRVKGNGFRSFLHVMKQLLEHLLSNLQKCARERSGLFFSVSDHLSTLTAYTRALQGIELMAKEAVILMKANEPPLLVNEGEIAESLKKLACTEDASRDAFYGHCLGFQYSQSLRHILQFLAISMASYEQWHSGSKEDPVKQLLSSLWKGSKYYQHPTERGIKIADMTHDSSIFFAKAFWSLTEQNAVKTVVKFVSMSVDVSKIIEIPAKNIIAKTVSGEEMTITPPFSDIGYKPITSTLVSYRLREGQPCSSYGKHRAQVPCSNTLIIHFHGGGFVAQTSQSHEFYLRWWSKELDCPILSVDYSLAPEAPFPRALEECVFCYAWALNNLEMLGTTGERIMLAGDSAGGNFAVTTAMKLKTLGLRQPDLIFSFYPATIVRSCVTPSRFLSLIDPLLPFGIMMSCLQAYTGTVPTDEVFAKRKEARKRILKAKGYIIPTPKSESPETKQQSKGNKFTGLQRSQTVPSKLSSTPSRPTPPSRPPPPKTGQTSSPSIKPKPRRPPPPKYSTTRRATAPEISSAVSFTSTSASVDLSFNSEEKDVEMKMTLKKEEMVTKVETVKEDEEAMFVVETVKEKEILSLTDEENRGDMNEDELEIDLKENQKEKDKGLTEVDLNSEQDLSIDETTVPQPPPQSTNDIVPPHPQTVCQPPPQSTNDIVPPYPQSQVSPNDSMMSVAPFFPSNVGQAQLRLGRQIPSKEEMLSDEEIERLTREILDTFNDPEITKDPFMSPGLAPDEFLKGLPPIHIIVCALDPLLDDGITLAQRLKSVGQPVTLNVMEGLSHGFLCFTGTDHITAAQERCTLLMKNALYPKK